MGEFRMPSLGADMTEGTLVEWLVKPGDPVRRGDIIAVVDTEKAVIEVEVFQDGVIDRLLVEPGTLVPVGTPLAHLRDGDAPSPPTEEPGQAPREQPQPIRQPAAMVEPVPAPDGPVPVTSPLVRRLAADKGIDLTSVTGTGPGGHITRDDVEAADRIRPTPDTRVRVSPLARRTAERLGVDPATVHGTGHAGAIGVADVERAAGPRRQTTEATTQPSRPQGQRPHSAAGTDRQATMQRAIANLMARSNREIPHYYLVHHIDLSRALAWLEQHNRDLPVAGRLLPAALLLKATALAARDHPALNGFWLQDRFEPGSGVHLGVAVALRGGGLVAPALHDADQAGLDELMDRLRDLLARARAGTLRSSEMADPTLTVTALGDRGVEGVYGVIYPPQVALVGFGKPVERPWAVDGMLGVHPVVLATLAADHRASNGHGGALFLAAIDRYLQKPEEL